ncbi:MAG: DUF523 domain-containing protein [Spirochaetales bacterium]|nr:DUF523 domain-containing protein [Candidatus Physcosoma equi]
MKLGVSACLVGVDCKNNGRNNRHEKLLQFLEGKDYVTICPEVLGGLSIPRSPAEIVGERVMTKDGQDVTEAYHKGAEKALEILKKEGVDTVILQSRSPSCGVKQVYDGSFQKILKNSSGISASLFQANGIVTIDVEDL